MLGAEAPRRPGRHPGAAHPLVSLRSPLPLMVAAMHGDLESVRSLIGHVTDVAAKDRAGHSALYYAVNAQKREIVDLLMSLTPNLELAYGDSGELLTLALGTPNTKIAQSIVSRLPRLEQWSAAALSALDNALRKALTNDYPELDTMELEDFRVRVLDESVGTGAVVRVLIDMSDGEQAWTTVGVSENIIEASWEALTDGYVYGLLHPRSNES